MNSPHRIDLRSSLSLRTAFRFPLQSPIARLEVIKGALWLLVPGFGWLLNMGHRIVMTHRMQHGLPAWPAWTGYRTLFRHGCLTFLGMVEYHSPAVLVEVLAWYYSLPFLHGLAAVLWLLATIAVPGYMSHYCFTLDPREIFDPYRALRRVFQGGAEYWHAWGIALVALALSFTGLLIFGIGFLVTSVWFWQVAGFSFATVFSQKFALRAGEEGCRSFLHEKSANPRPDGMDRLMTLKKAIELIHSVLSNAANASPALDQWPVAEAADQSLLETAKWQIIYIDHDADIRSREPEYKTAQMSALRDLLTTIQRRVAMLEAA